MYLAKASAFRFSAFTFHLSAFRFRLSPPFTTFAFHFKKL